VEGRPIETVAGLREAIQAAQGHTPWRITFLRGGRRRVVSLVPQA
jgi:S1-C subfamily serine protease